MENIKVKLNTGNSIKANVTNATNNSSNTDLSNYYTKQQTDARIAAAQPDLTPYALKTEIPDTSDFATKEELENIELTPGPAGAPGTDGVTPHIGENGNWFIGDTDTGTAATGPKGADGTDGFSPTVTTTPIDGGTRVIITDATGDHSFDVMNGTGGNTNPTWVAYSPEEYVLDGVNDTYAMWLDNSRFSTPAAVGSYGMVIAKGQAGTDGTEAKSWIFVGEVLLPNSPIEGKTFVQVKFPLEIDSGGTVDLSNYYNKEQVDEKIAAIPTGGGAAADISYDDTNTNLGSDNPNAPIDTVQKAIEALAEDDIGSQQVQDMIDSTSMDNKSYKSLLNVLLSSPDGSIKNFGIASGTEYLSKEQIIRRLFIEKGGCEVQIDIDITMSDLGITNSSMLPSLFELNNNILTSISINKYIPVSSGWRYEWLSSSALIKFKNYQELKKYFTSHLHYDNATSGLAATTLSGAIDELASKFNSITNAEEVRY